MMVHVAGVTMEEETEEKISNREAKRAQVCLTGKKEYEKTNYERIAKKEQGWFVGCCMKEEKPEELCRHICSHEGEEGHSDQWGLLRVTGETTVKVRSRPKYGYWQLGARMCCRAIKDPDWKEKKKPPAVLHGGPDDTAVVTCDQGWLPGENAAINWSYMCPSTGREKRSDSRQDKLMAWGWGLWTRFWDLWCPKRCSQGEDCSWEQTPHVWLLGLWLHDW